MQNPFEPNIKLVISELTSPFTPITLGEGGLNSGAKLDLDKDAGKRKYVTTTEFSTPSARIKRHNLNAQRLYRQRNREDYNEYMLALWQKNRDAKEGTTERNRYDDWVKNQKIANKNYRLKKLIQNPPEKTIERELRKEFKENTPKKVGRRKKNEKTYKEKEEDYVNDTANIEKMRNKVIKKYKEEYEEFLQQNADRKLSKTPVYVVGEYEYKQYDPTGLQIASKTKPVGVDAPTKLQHNLKELKDYYESVLTDIRPADRIPSEWEKGKSRFYPPIGISTVPAGQKLIPTNFVKKREEHSKVVEKYPVKEKPAVKSRAQGEKLKE